MTQRKTETRQEYRARQRQYRSNHAEQARSYQNEYRAKNRERYREIVSKWRQRNLEIVKEKRRAYYLKNKERMRAAKMKWHYANYEKHMQSIRLNGAKYRLAIRKEVLEAYGNKCACCGESAEEFLTIDHIDGRGSHHRKEVGPRLYAVLRRLGFPKDKYRLLCMNCNFSYGMRGYCPHQRKIQVA